MQAFHWADMPCRDHRALSCQVEKGYFVRAKSSPWFLETVLHQELLGIAEGICFHSPNKRLEI